MSTEAQPTAEKKSYKQTLNLPQTAFAMEAKLVQNEPKRLEQWEAMRLYEKAKRLGTWDPSAIDLARDAADWTRMTEDERLAIEQISALFLVGEEAVTLDLLPLVLAIAREGRLEEELFLTTFLFEEGKHTQFFRRFLDEVAGSPPELLARHGNLSYSATIERAQ